MFLLIKSNFLRCFLCIKLEFFGKLGMLFRVCSAEFFAHLKVLKITPPSLALPGTPLKLCTTPLKLKPVSTYGGRQDC